MHIKNVWTVLTKVRCTIINGGFEMQELCLRKTNLSYDYYLLKNKT
jgi:hypothetical protein